MAHFEKPRLRGQLSGDHCGEWQLGVASFDKLGQCRISNTSIEFVRLRSEIDRFAEIFVHLVRFVIIRDLTHLSHVVVT